MLDTPPPSHHSDNISNSMNITAATSVDDDEELVPVRPKRIDVLNPTMDLDVYISNYEGYGKISRLEFIGEVCRDLRIDAYCLALALLRTSHIGNTQKYCIIANKLMDTIHEQRHNNIQVPAESLAAAQDNAWVDAMKKSMRAKTEKLEAELRNYKTNLIKESIRMGHQDLGDHYFACGDMTNALKSYSRTRDYCTTPKHIVDMCLNVIKVSIEIHNFSHVLSYAAKAEAVPDTPDRVIVLSKLKCAVGLANLSASKFKNAAKNFLEVSFKLGSGYSEILSPNDIAIYGGLTALASLSRTELKSKVFDNPEFRQFLELEPQVRQLLELFYSSKYGACLSLLHKMRDDLLLDLHLHEHVDTIVENIRRKALTQYFSPFLSVDLIRMAASFNTDVKSLETDLESLIVEKLIPARIDSFNKILRIKHTDQRSAVFEKSIKMGQEYQRQSRHMMLRASLMRQDLYVVGEGGGGGHHQFD